MMSEVTLYGIPNCDTVKKARRWLNENDIAYNFHNFKKEGVPTEILATWIDVFGLEKVVNRRGTTWRKLDGKQKALLEVAGEAALNLLTEESSLIKRPVLQKDDQTLIGFSPDDWSSALKR